MGAAMPSQKIVEGIFAVNKPPSLTSAQVLRELQKVFNASTLFAPWLAAQRSKQESKSGNQKKRHRNRRFEVKLGHGGTLDPMATGVLIVGVGSGTKGLAKFLECTKSYTATILFGASSDTYDITGKLLHKAPCSHITRSHVENALEQFRGSIMQKPPLYSALRLQGKRLYEYAREGKEPPVEIEERNVHVEELSIVEWFDPGSHSFSLPKEETGPDARASLTNVSETRSPTGEGIPEDHTNSSAKRKRLEDESTGLDESGQPQKVARTGDTMSEGAESSSNQYTPRQKHQEPYELTIPAVTKDSLPNPTIEQDPNARDEVPAAKLFMTTSSGFYVRSLCHDLGKAVESLATMATLTRDRQANFRLQHNVLEYEDFSKGEEIWGPKVEAMLDDWRKRQT